MINIAICDNEKSITGFIEKSLEIISIQQNININCSVYLDSSFLLTAIKVQQLFFDLIYIDIEIGNNNSIKAVQEIRSMNIPTLIIYLSRHRQSTEKLLYTEPFRFLQKPINIKEFHGAFLAACEKIWKEKAYFSFFYNKTFYKIPLNKIAYFESRGRIIFIHMAESLTPGTFINKFYGKMNDIDKQISSMSNRFLRIHQSFLINYDYILNISLTHAVMMDGRHVQISEKRRKHTRERFYWLLDATGEKNK